MKLLTNICFVLMLLTSAGGASGSDGTDSPFSFGAGARELALGGAAITGAGDATTVYWNPSGLSLVQRISLTGMHTGLLMDGSVYQYFGIVVPTLDIGGFGMGLFRQSIGDIEKRDSYNSYLGEFDDSHLRLYLGYGRRLSRFEVGASLSLDHQSIDTYSATSSPGLSLSATHRYEPKQTWLSDFTVSVIVRSLIKPGIKLADETYRYPTVLELGGSVRIVPEVNGYHTIEPFMMFQKTESVPLRFHAGLEYTYKELAQLRLGLRQNNFSCGAGINLGVISFDYALVDRDLDPVHLFALTGFFGLSVDERRASRAQKQEAEFRDAMNLQMQRRNLSLINELLVAGQLQLDSAQYDEAVGSFDRLVFLARSNGLDETPYEALLDSAINLRESSQTTNLLQSSVDSAQVHLASGDFMSARYYALKALEVDSTYELARHIFEQSDRSLRAQTTRSEFFSEQLARVDSLLDSRRLDQAEQVIRSLMEVSPSDDAVVRRANRLELEKLRRQIASMESKRDENIRLQARLPEPEDKADSTQPAASAKALSEEQYAELDRLYQEAKVLFNNGDIKAAIKRWETVAAQAPDFQSVKEFLVKAYRFLGLELYGQKQRAEAIAVWKKALVLDPNNEDIAEYIKRAETQMKKLEELAHEQI